jgi:2-amino-4-hydroxy-6-hydroxymethyldihydropteridine diphosphokinase
MYQIVKKIDNSNILYKTMLYPYKSNLKGVYPYCSLLAIGGNIGDVKRRFNHLFFYLKSSPFLKIIESSPILKNPPIGYLNQDDFYNALILVETSLQPKELLRYIWRIEKRFGRKRLFKDSPRTLDIDIIFYENRIIKEDNLTIPHISWKERDFIKIPMSYMKSSYIREVNI